MDASTRLMATASNAVTSRLYAAAASEDTTPSAACLAPGALWITWEFHRRTRELSRSFGAELVELTAGTSGIARYAALLWQTTVCLARRRPAVLLIQCPSILLALWVTVLKPLFRYALVADLHNEAVVPFNYNAALYRAALRLIHRAADVSLVSNEALNKVVDASGGRGFVLPDKVPDLAVEPPGSRTADRPQVVFVCSYAPDEPVLEVIEAAVLIGPSIDLHVTGDPRRFNAAIPNAAHVHLTGYLPEGDYERLLQRADVIVDLTRMEECLVCGAYEAVALEKPLVTSDTQALRGYFSKGAVYSAHDPAALCHAIQFALSERRRLTLEMAELKRELSYEWAARRDNLCTLVRREFQ